MAGLYPALAASASPSLLLLACVLPSVSAFNAPSSLALRPNALASPRIASRNPRRHACHSLRATSNPLLSDQQKQHTAERLGGMSRGEVQHIFEDVDRDGNGMITMDELDFLVPYFSDSHEWTPSYKKTLFSDIDKSQNGSIDSEEFYDWMVFNAEAEGGEGLGSKVLKKRAERLVIGDGIIPPHLLSLLDDFGTGGIVQKVTHPLHSAFGRSLREHFISCYVLLEQWGNPKEVVEAGLFHALYQRGDGMRAVNADETRPMLQEKLGKDVEELIYLFPSAHKSAYEPDGLLHAPLGQEVTVKNVLTGGEITFDEERRRKLVELEVVNSHDQNVLENVDPVHNLWSFYQHATVMPLLSQPAQQTIKEFLKRSYGASCADIVSWHESRFRETGKPIPDNWDRHLDMFRPGGRYLLVEEELHHADKNGDGEIDWQEFTEFLSSKFRTCQGK